MKFIAVGPQGRVRGEDAPTAGAARLKAFAAYKAKHGAPAKGTVKLVEVGGSSPKPETKPKAKPASRKGKDTGVRPNPSEPATGKKPSNRGKKDGTRPNPGRAGITLTASEEMLIRELRASSSPARTIEALAARWKVPVIVTEGLPMRLNPAMMREGMSFVLGTNADGDVNYLEMMPGRTSARATASGKAVRHTEPVRRLPKKVKHRIVALADSHPAVYVED